MQPRGRRKGEWVGTCRTPQAAAACAQLGSREHPAHTNSQHPLADLVFIQNGMLQPWLDSRGLGDNTQVRPGCRLLIS